MSNAHLQMTDALASYLRAASPEEPSYLTKLREETASHPRAIMQITPEQGLPANKQQPVDIYQWQVKGIGCLKHSSNIAYGLIAVSCLLSSPCPKKIIALM